MSTSTEPTDSQLDPRYIFIGGGGIAGGWLTNLGPAKNLDVAIPTVAPVHLPTCGGVSEAAVQDYSFKYTASHFPKVSRKLTLPLVGKDVLYIQSATCSTTAGPEVAAQPRVLKTWGEGKSTRIDSRVFVDEVSFSVESSQAPGVPYPTIKIDGKFPTLTLDGFTVDIEIDTKGINSVPTQTDLEKAFKSKKLSSSMQRTLAVDPKTGSLRRSVSNYIITSIVKSIKGKLPPGAYVEPNGYIINWPDFGKIILGEVLIAPYMRRVTMLRIKRSDFELYSGCGGGSEWP